VIFIGRNSTPGTELHGYNADVKRIVAIALLEIAVCGWSLGQERGQDISFHVTAVRSEDATDWCPTGECDATRITVEGYSATTEYVLDCVEVITHKPSPHYSDYCDHVHAHNDYDATLWPANIGFKPIKSKTADGAPVSLYRIVSEKEMSKKK
jgi:hypothetical protein